MKRMTKERLIVEAISEVGRIKKINQDHILVKVGELNKEEFGVFAVADGIGGLSAGEYASAVTIQKIDEWWEQSLPSLLIKNSEPMNKIIEGLTELVKKINIEILDKSKEENQKMGTTLSILFLYRDNYYVLHIGDSRIYRVIDLVMEQLTEDHSYVGNMVTKGIITGQEAKVHPKRNVLTRSLGVSKDIEVFQRRGKLMGQEDFILCSDGFYNLLEEDEIAITMKIYRNNLKMGLKYLTSIVNERGAYDNLSVIFIGCYD